MKSLSIIILIVVLLLIIVFTIRTKKNQAFTNTSTGTCTNDINYKREVAFDLGNYLLMSLDKINVNNKAIMFDIDDTLIDSKSRKVIKPMLKLLNKAKRKKFKVIIITARDKKWYSETIEELRINKIYYDLLYLRNPANDRFETFKSNIKEQLNNKHGIETMISVGDQIHDIDGNYSGYGIKLPAYYDYDNVLSQKYGFDYKNLLYCENGILAEII